MAKSTPPLNGAMLRNIQPPATGREDHADGACPGLRLRVTATGRQTWLLCCRDSNGRMRYIVLGERSAQFGLSAAREQARASRMALRAGADPIKERRQKRETAERRKHADTLISLLAAYETYVVCPRQAQGKARSWPESRRRIEDVFKQWQAVPLEDLSSTVLQQTIDKHPSRSSAAAACRYIRPVLRWAELRGLIAVGTGAALTQPEGVNQVRHRVLTDAELRNVWQALPDLAQPYGDLFKFLMLTCCRLSEATSARWQDVDFNSALWTIPQTKQGHPHAVPLSRQALALFAKRAKNIDPSALIFGTRTGGHLSNFDRTTKKLQRLSNTSNWHRHDMRRTSATLMANCGTPPHVVEMVLGHALVSSSDGSRLGRVAAVYNKSRYENDTRTAIQALSDEIESICNHKE